MFFLSSRPDHYAGIDCRLYLRTIPGSFSRRFYRCRVSGKMHILHNFSGKYTFCTISAQNAHFAQYPTKVIILHTCKHVSFKISTFSGILKNFKKYFTYTHICTCAHAITSPHHMRTLGFAYVSLTFHLRFAYVFRNHNMHARCRSGSGFRLRSSAVGRLFLPLPASFSAGSARKSAVCAATGHLSGKTGRSLLHAFCRMSSSVTTEFCRCDLLPVSLFSDHPGKRSAAGFGPVISAGIPAFLLYTKFKWTASKFKWTAPIHSDSPPYKKDTPL